MSSVVVTSTTLVASQVLALLGLWLRLRSRVQMEEAHRELLIDVLCLLPWGGQVDDQRTAGASLTKIFVSGPAAHGPYCG